MKKEFIKALNGKNVKAKTKYSETLIGKLEVINDSVIKIGKTLLEPNVILQLEEIEEKETKEVKKNAKV